MEYDIWIKLAENKLSFFLNRHYLRLYRATIKKLIKKGKDIPITDHGGP
jgi:hypothetical protein